MGWDWDRRKYRYLHNINAAELRVIMSERVRQTLDKIIIAGNPFDRSMSKYFHDQVHRHDERNQRVNQN
jgi:hypothetical protein